MTLPTAPLLTTIGGLVGASAVIVVEHGLQATQDLASGTYTATEIATFMAAVGVLITGVGAVVVNIIVALRQGVKVDQLRTTVDEVKNETKVITGHVNSAATASAMKIDALEKKIEMLVTSAAEKQETAKLLAQSVATRTSPPGPAAPVVAAVIKDLHSVHEQIETNTRETAEAVKNLEKPDPDKR